MAGLAGPWRPCPSYSSYCALSSEASQKICLRPAEVDLPWLLKMPLKHATLVLPGAPALRPLQGAPKLQHALAMAQLAREAQRAPELQRALAVARLVQGVQHAQAAARPAQEVLRALAVAQLAQEVQCAEVRA